jgi:hypothetical protein
VLAGGGRIEDMTAEMRLKIIPLALTRGEDLLMDANVRVVSTALMTQKSCMGLYPKYEDVGRNGGRVTCLYGEARALCAVATMKKNGERWFVDVMCAAGAEDARKRTIMPLIDGKTELWARIASKDDRKQGFFAGLGFRATGEIRPPEEELPLETEMWTLPAAQG